LRDKDLIKRSPKNLRDAKEKVLRRKKRKTVHHNLKTKMYKFKRNNQLKENSKN